MSMDIVVRALGGSMDRKRRAVVPDFGLKGEKVVATEVRYLVIILAILYSREVGEHAMGGRWRAAACRRSQAILAD